MKILLSITGTDIKNLCLQFEITREQTPTEFIHFVFTGLEAESLKYQDFVKTCNVVVNFVS